VLIVGHASEFSLGPRDDPDRTGTPILEDPHAGCSFEGPSMLGRQGRDFRTLGEGEHTRAAAAAVGGDLKIIAEVARSTDIRPSPERERIRQCRRRRNVLPR
jgi:hypothetical protein